MFVVSPQSSFPASSNEVSSRIVNPGVDQEPMRILGTNPYVTFTPKFVLGPAAALQWLFVLCKSTGGKWVSFLIRGWEEETREKAFLYELEKAECLSLHPRVNREKDRSFASITSMGKT